ncbi:Ser/Thr protein kinase [Medusavirus stheno T3]|uniref:Ser/Thr protein kinase n=1 Tax=Medusavirus stheno T3 TaxID=3069717 RepID=A0A7S7YET9_9VIRU|nr:Ser/Thr protein kinase [Acanthamoeba castellanii medusavirus]QPB44486.1 Ser/Thr protein kinase [Medusavirus stheno T3]
MERFTHRFKGTFGVYGVCARQKSAALGEGSSASVFTCTEVATGRQFALKLVWSAHTGDEIYKEAAGLAWTNNAPGFVRLVDIVTLEQGNTSQPCTGLVLQLHARGSLDRLASSRGFRERLDTAPLILRDILRSLCWLHDAGFVHRDIKPANLLMSEGEGEGVVLADLGRCILVNQLDYMVNATTPLVEAPEQMACLSHDCSADLWSAGVTVLAYVFAQGDARGEFDRGTVHDVYFRNLVRPPPGAEACPISDAPLAERVEAFFTAYGSPSGFLRSLCRAARLPSNYSDRHFAFCETLDGIMERDAAARWSAQDALHVLETTQPQQQEPAQDATFEDPRTLRRRVKRRVAQLLPSSPDEAQIIVWNIFRDSGFGKEEMAKRALATFVEHWRTILLGES